MADKQLVPEFWQEWLSDCYAMPYDELVAYVQEHGDTPTSGPMGQIKKILSETRNRDYMERLGRKGGTVTFRRVV